MLGKALLKQIEKQQNATFFTSPQHFGWEEAGLAVAITVTKFCLSSVLGVPPSQPIERSWNLLHLTLAVWHLPPPPCLVGKIMTQSPWKSQENILFGGLSTQNIQASMATATLSRGFGMFCTSQSNVAHLWPLVGHLAVFSMDGFGIGFHFISLARCDLCRTGIRTKTRTKGQIPSWPWLHLNLTYLGRNGRPADSALPSGRITKYSLPAFQITI